MHYDLYIYIYIYIIGHNIPCTETVYVPVLPLHVESAHNADRTNNTSNLIYSGEISLLIHFSLCMQTSFIYVHLLWSMYCSQNLFCMKYMAESKIASFKWPFAALHPRITKQKKINASKCILYALLLHIRRNHMVKFVVEFNSIQSHLIYEAIEQLLSVLLLRWIFLYTWSGK